MSEEAPIVRMFRLQAGACRELGSPLTAELLERAAADWGDGGPTATLMRPWAEADLRRLIAEAAALRLAAALHDLALSGEDPALAEAYASHDAARVWPLALAAMTREQARLAGFMRHEPQTNEVRRSTCLVGGFLEVAKETGLPLRCFEIGASAGLNLSWDSYRYQLGDDAWGPTDAPLVLQADWTGPPPATEADVRVIARAGCDRRPTDLADPEQRRRLLAYIWADQADRFARIEAAIGLALERGVHLETADAVDWTRARVGPEAGAATVLYHSVFWQYMPAQSQAALAELIAATGARASREAPFAWLRMETSPQDGRTMEVWLTLWPSGEQRRLAVVHAHGAWVEWQA